MTISPFPPSRYIKNCEAIINSQNYNNENVEGLFHNLNLLFEYVIAEKPSIVESPSGRLAMCDSLPLGPLATEIIRTDILSKVVTWASAKQVHSSEVKLFILSSLLRSCDFLISQSKQNLLFSPPIFQSLLKLTDLYCKTTDRLSEDFSRLLYTLSVLMCRDPILLELSKQVSHDVTRNDYFIFSCLVPLLHLSGAAGNYARDALLLILALSERDNEVATYLTSKSDICPVLATGLSAHFSCLPKRLVCNGTSDYFSGDTSQIWCSSEALHVRGVGWHRITRPEYSNCETLERFLQALEFCNLAVRISHQAVRQCLLYYIYSGFLMSVLRPALTQKGVNEVTAAEAYMELFLRRLTEPALIGLFLRFIVASNDDNDSVLSILVTRIDSHSTLGTVTLSLFRTILNLNCEDIFFILVFQYLNRMKVLSNPTVYADSKKRDGAVSPMYADNVAWLASSERFLKLSFWCTGFTDPLNNSSAGPMRLKVVPSGRLASCLLSSHIAIDSRTRDTNMWTAEYQSAQMTPLVPTISSIDATSAPLHSTPLRNLMTSGLGIESSSMSRQQQQQLQELAFLDRYKSTSNLYQLMYFEDSDEESRPESPLKPPSCFPALSVTPIDHLDSEFKRRKPIQEVIHQLICELESAQNGNSVDLFIRLLDREIELDSEGDYSAVNLPYPPVSQFELDMLDYRLGRSTTPDLALDEPMEPMSGDFATHSPFQGLETDYDFESLYGNELPELSYQSNYEERSLHYPCSSSLGPFLICLLDRIATMHKSCLYSNLLLTDIILILGSFHQFPLSEVLLRCADVRLKSSVPTLYQILVGLRHQLELEITKIPNWSDLIEQAMRFLRGPNHRNPGVALPSAVAMAPKTSFATDEVLLEMGGGTVSPRIVAQPRSRTSARPYRSCLSNSDFSLASPVCPITNSHYRSVSVSSSSCTYVLEPVLPSGPTGASNRLPRVFTAFPIHRARRSSIDRLTQILSFTTPRGPKSSTPDEAPTTSLPVVSVSTRNIIFAYIVFNEFCLELASLCCEHAVSAASVQPHFEKTMDLEQCLAGF